jgi:Subtilase family
MSIRNRRRELGLIWLSAGFMFAPSGLAWSQADDTVKNVTVPEIQSIETEKESRTPAQQKIGSQILEALKQQASGAAASVPGLKINNASAAKKGALVDIDAQVDDKLLNSIRSAGGTIVNFYQQDHAIRAYVPLEKLEGIASRPEVNSIIPAAKATTNVMRLAQEGAVAHGIAGARSAFRVTGAGVKIGVISDSIDTDVGSLKAALASGAVSSATLSTLRGEGGEGSGEGLAMAEIVHAVAPGASMIFATGNGSAAHMAANIRALQKAGCKVIVDDLTYFNESPFQDGPIARAVNDVTSAGVLYFSSARNSGNKKHQTSGTWEGDFADGGPATGEVAGSSSGNRIHLFAPNVTANTVVTVSDHDRVDLFWADPLGKSANDYNLYVIDPDGHVVNSSTTSHTGKQDPYQSISGLSAGQSIVITKSASAAPLFMHLDTGRAVLSISTEGSVRGHNASGAKNAFSVAAIRVPNPLGEFTPGSNVSVEEFSSDGPRRMFFRPDGTATTPGDFSSRGGLILEKPDVAAADGVSTSLPSGALNPFFGTSAAAPHAAAVAALLLQLDPTLSSDDIKDILVSSARPIDGDGRNNTAGAGLVMPFAALRTACQKKSSSCPTQPAQQEAATGSISVSTERKAGPARR